MHRTLVKSAVLASVVFGAGAANAEVVAFENPAPGEPGHFDWATASGQDVLSVLLAPESQPGVFDTPGAARIDAYYGAFLKGGDATDFQGLNVYGYSLVVGVDAGEMIPTLTLGFWSNAYVYTTYGGATVSTLLPEGESTYLGVQFDQGFGVQYGWIGIVRNGFDLDAFAWGYETEPGVPIAAGAGLGTPCPGDLTGDDTVNFDDLLDLFGQWGECAPPSPCPGDLAEPADGVVNFDDLLALFAEWGDC